MLPSSLPWQLLAVIIIIAIAALVGFAYFNKLARLIKDTPTSKIRSAAQGFVELEGIAAQSNTVSPSPLTQRPCIWFEYRIERRTDSGKNQSWRTISSNRHPGPIVVDDTTGICFVRLGNARVYGGLKNTWYGASSFPSSLSVDRRESFLQMGNYRYTETIIAPGSPIYAMGHFSTRHPVESFQHDQVVKQTISKWKQQYDKLLERFDRNNDGELDEKEWKLVRMAANLEAEDHYAEQLEKSAVHTLDKKSGLPMIVATEDQRHLGRKFRIYSFLFVAIFAADIAYLVHIIKPFL